MAELPLPEVAFTQQDILDLFDRLLPQHYLAPLKSVGPGYEVLQAYAKLFARISLALQNLGGDSQIATAQAGAKATGVVQLLRPSALTTGVPIPGQQGNTASIVAGAPGGQMRVTGLSGMSAASVGRFLVLSNTVSVQNTGGFLIATFNSPSSVDVVNASAVIPDADNGAIQWVETTRTVLVKAGTVVTTSKGGRDFVTTADVLFNPSDLGPFNVPVQAIAVGYEWNVTGKRTAADGEVLPGEIDTVKTLTEDPQLADLTIEVQQIADTSGGQDASLDGLGFDRGILRLSGETDDKYRSRVRALPDTVSPDALNRAVGNMLNPFNIGFSIIETWDIAYVTCWDGPSTTFVGSDYNPNQLAFDNPVTVPFRARWLDENNYRGGVIVVVENVQPIQDVGMAWYPDPPISLTPVPGQTGVAASIVAGAAFGRMRVTGLTGMVSGSVGRFLTITGAASAPNDGSFLIVQLNSPTSVDVVNASAIIPDANNGALVWSEGTRNVTDPDAASLASPQTGGARAVDAFDVPSSLGFGYLQGGYDGFDLPKQSLYKGLYDTLQSIKPAGVSVAVELKGQ